MRSLFFSLIVCLWTAPVVGQFPNVLVNEVMASNDGIAVDEDGNDEDWIELYNADPVAVDLAGYWISDDPTRPAKHQLDPAGGPWTIAPGGFLLLWCGEGSDRLSFNLSGSGESVLVTAPDGVTVLDAVTFGEQYTNVSFGRTTDGATQWSFFGEPTPGASNNTAEGSAGRLGPVTFSTTAGFVSAPFDLQLSHNDPEAVIYWSFDGSDPGPHLLEPRIHGIKHGYAERPSDRAYPLVNDTMRAFVYAAPIHIGQPEQQSTDLTGIPTAYDRTYRPEYMPPGALHLARVVRARAYKPGYLPGPVTAATYFFTPGGSNAYPLPVVSIITDRKGLVDFNEGIMVAGVDFEEWRAANPNGAASFRSGSNWKRSTEIPISIQYFETGERHPVVDMPAGVRMHGGASRARPRKSMRLYFRNRYGSNTVGHAIFPDHPRTDHRRLILHNSGNDERRTNLRDMTLQAMMRHLRFDIQLGRPTLQFINGEYWGVLALRRRYDRHFLEQEYGLPEGSLDLVQTDRTVEEGDLDGYNALLNMANALRVADPDAETTVRRYMDLEGYTDYMSANIFLGNSDWPHNNVRMFRKRVPYTPDAPIGHDGRWRWLMFDTDYGFNVTGTVPVTFDMIAWCLSPTGNGFGADRSLLFRKLAAMPFFREAFVSRHADLLNTAYAEHRTQAVIDSMVTIMRVPMRDHFPRWLGRPGSETQWNADLHVMYDHATRRPQHARAELIRHFALTGPYHLLVDVSDPQHGYVRVNTIDILETTVGVEPEPYPWIGQYFGNVPVKLTATPLPGYRFAYWEGDVESTEASISVNMEEAMDLRAVFEPGPVCEQELLYYWHFNDMGGDTRTSVAADVTVNDNAVISYPGAGAGYMDGTNTSEGSTLNALPDVLAGRGLRVRNPSDGRMLLIEAPTTGFRDAELAFATMRTNNGAEYQRVEWTTDPERETWSALGEAYSVPLAYTIKRFSLAGVMEAMDQEHLAFRILFEGNNASAASGNDRFDNITIAGWPLTVTRVERCDTTAINYAGQLLEGLGPHLVTIDSILDCGNIQLLRSVISPVDTTVVFEDGTLEVAQIGATYQWLDCGAGFAMVEGADERSFAPTSNGRYAVDVTYNGCTERSGCHVVLRTGLADPATAGISVHPNPANSVLYVALPEGSSALPALLVDAAGRTVRNMVLQGRTSVDLVGLDAGVYILLLEGHAPVRVVKR